MAFSSILSSSNAEPKPPAPLAHVQPPANDPRKPSRTSAHHASPGEENRPAVRSREPSRSRPAVHPAARSGKSKSTVEHASGAPAKTRPGKNKPTGPDKLPPPPSLPAPAPAPAPTAPALTDDITMDDLHSPEVDKERLIFKERSRKRMADMELAEAKKRKVRAPSLASALRLHHPAADRAQIATSRCLCRQVGRPARSPRPSR